MKTNKKLFLLLLLGAMCTTVMAQRHTDKLDRGLVAVPVGAAGNSQANLVSWRRLASEHFDVTYKLYKNGNILASNLTNTCYNDGSNAPVGTKYQVAAVVNGVEQEKCDTVTAWNNGNAYKPNGNRYAYGYLNITLAKVFDRNGNEVTDHYQPNDAEVADLDGDGQFEIIVKRLNTVDAAGIYLESSREFVVLDAYDVNWQTGAATLMWRIDCGPNMASMNSTEINIIAYDWDEDGKAEVVLRGADNMIVYGPDGKKKLYTIGSPNVNTRNKMNSHTDSQYAWTHTGAEYLVYMDGETGKLYQQIAYPLPRLESGESSEKSAWGDDYGHRSTKHFLGAPFLDGRKASLFLGRGIYTRHKMIAMDLDRVSHEWKELWRWNCNNSNSPWYGNGYHNFVIADVDEDGRDEIVYGSMVIDDNGKGLSTTGLGHGDAQHVGDFDPYRPGLEFFGCNEDNPGMNYRNATTSEIYYRQTAGDDDGRCLIGNFSSTIPGCLGRSVSTGLISSVKDVVVADGPTGNNDGLFWSHLNFRTYWDGDLGDEILDSPGTEGAPAIWDHENGRIFVSRDDEGASMNNDSKNNPCFQGDIIGDWREEIIVRWGTNIRVYATGIGTNYSLPTLWNDHQYRQAMVWQMMAYNQPPHLSYFLGELEDITVAPPTLTNEGRTEIENGGTISSGSSNDHLLIAKTDNMTVNVSDGAAPAVLVVNTPTWVQGHDNNNNITTTTYTHTLTGGAFTGAMRLVKQGNGILQLPNVTETYTGNTDVWAGTLRFNGTMQNSAVWLNRFTALETDGGKFLSGIEANYAATIKPGNEGLTTTTLTLNHGARLMISIGSDGKATTVNADKLVLNTKNSDAWKQYGPQYLKPVIEFTQSGLLDGAYFLGNIGSVTGSIVDDIVLEGLDGVNDPRLIAVEGKMFLIVGTGETGYCPEPTFAVSGYQTIDHGLLPVVSIDPGTFTYGGNDVIPTLSAKFNGNPVDLTTLYSEDYQAATDTSAWTTRFATLELAPEKHINIKQGGGSGPRSAYTKFYTSSFYGNCKSYAIEFDAYFHYTNGNYDPNELVIFGEGAGMPYSNQIFNSPNYLFKIRGGKNWSTDYWVEGTSTSFRLNDYQWYHYTIRIDKISKKVDYTISSNNGGETVASGSYDITDSLVNLNAQGMEVGLGRASSQAGVDNIRIYRTDGYYYTFDEPGTLTVTTSYPGCQSATATYEVTEAIMPGDVNGDRVVNILDVAQTISHIVGQTPDGFRKAAADIDCNGLVDKTDLDAIVRLIAWQ